MTHFRNQNMGNRWKYIQKSTVKLTFRYSIKQWISIFAKHIYWHIVHFLLWLTKHLLCECCMTCGDNEQWSISKVQLIKKKWSPKGFFMKEKNLDGTTRPYKASIIKLITISWRTNHQITKQKQEANGPHRSAEQQKP